MNIYAVRDNLIKTIEGKEEMLLAVQHERTFVGLRDGEDIALSTTAQFLQINIDELKRILKDVTICCNQATEASWFGVDRQGGIQYNSPMLTNREQQIIKTPFLWRMAVEGHGVINEPQRYGLTREEFDEFIKEYNQYLDEQKQKETA